MSSSSFLYLLLLVPVIAVGYVIWSYRSKAAAKDAASRERLAALVMAPQAARAAANAAEKQPAASAPAGTPPAAAPAAAPAPAPAARHERLLTQPETLLYYVLKAGLPDHEIFPRVSMAAVIDQPEQAVPSARGGQARHDFDFVVCQKSMQAVAVVQLAAQALPEPVRRRLGAAGIRVVSINPAALPRREQVRSLLFGEPAEKG